MYKLIKRFLVFLIPLVSLLVFQCLADPFDKYSWQLLPPQQHNPRRDKVESYLANGKYDYDIFVLRTSRSMRLNFGENSFNFGVFSARAEDVYCILRFILDHSTTPPKYIIISVDPWLFYNATSTISDLLREPLLSKYLLFGTSGLHEFRVNVLQSTHDSLLYSLVALRNCILGGEDDTFIETKPGTGSFLNYYSHCHLEELSSKSILAVTNTFKFHTALDTDRVIYFNKFIELCRSNSIKVLGFIAPMHPHLDKALRDQGIYHKRLGEIKVYLDNITYEGFSYVDFSLPELFNGDDYDFFDPTHIGDYNATLIIQQLLNRL